MKKVFVYIVLGLTCFVCAQKKVDKQQLIWYGYYNSLKFNENWTLRSEIQERQFVNPTSQHQLVFRSNLERKIADNLQGFVGMTWFFQNSNDPNSSSNLTVPELRPDVGFASKQSYKFVTFNHRYKLEARFFHDVFQEALIGGYRFSNFRFRYQLGFDIPVYKKNGKEKVVFKLKDEIMFNFGKKIVKNTFDQNRIYAAIHYKLNKAIAIELGYMNWFQQQKSGIDFYNRDILRFSIFHNITI